MIRRPAAVALVVSLVGAAGVAADANDAPQPNSSGVSRHARAINDAHSEGRFVSVDPCRAVDTKVVSNNMASGETRSFKAKGGTSFAGQGGNGSGCAIPEGAVAIQATMTAVADGSGYISAFAQNASEPATSFMNKSSTANLAVGGVIPVSGAIGANNLKLHNVGSGSRVILDITGYFIPGMWASVNGDGTLGANAGLGATKSNSRVVISGRTGTGVYQVVFDRIVLNCSYDATPFGTGQILVQPQSGNPTAVMVVTQNSAGVATDTPFYLTVDCS